MKALLRKIRQILRDRKTRRIFTRLVSTVAAIVVFVTTYALVLPAITMESEAACGIEAHQHDQSCYTDVLVCELPESPGHVHDESCYITKEKQVCQIEEHVHDSDCYDGNGKLICEKDEHQHGEDCFEEVRELVCEIPESPGHQHDDSCYQKVLTCGREVHTHSTACYRADTASQAATEAIAVASTESAAAATRDGLIDNLNASAENSEPEIGLDSSIENNVIEDNLDASPDNNDPGSDLSLLTDKVGNDEPGAWTSTEATADATAGTAASTGSGAGVTGSTSATTGSSTGGTVATAVSAAATDTMSVAAGYVPVLDELNFDTLLNKHTGIYYSRLAGTDSAVDNETNGADAAKNTGEPQEAAAWNRIDKHTELKESDNLRLYLAYTIPAGSLNETNQTARYSLPQNIRLTDEQIDEINTTVNGIAGQYVSYDTLEILDQEMYGKYLGIEAVEGTRTPADNLDEYLANYEGQEFISATVKVENVFDENTGFLKAQDLVFAFAPYTIQKNQHQYDFEGQPIKAGEEVSGWLAIDVSTEQIDWEKADDETKTADIIFVEKDKKSDLKEISTELRLVGAEVDSDTDTNVENAAKGVSSDVAATDNKQGGTKDSEATVGESDKAEKEPVSYPSVSFDDSIIVAGGSLSTDTDVMSGDAGMVAETEITVHVEADKDTFSEGTTMVLSAVSDDQITAVAEAVEGAVDAPKTMGFHAVDISFRDAKGNEIEPLKPIRVSMTSDAIKRAVENQSTAPVVVHVSDPSADQDAADEDTDEGGSTDATDSDEAEDVDSQHILDSSESTEERALGSNLETTPSANIIETDTGTKENNGDTLIFEAEAFSVYAIVYTVDFHYEINGKMYEFSIPGGGFVSLEHVVEVLGIASADENTENGAENTENSAENGNDFVGEVSGVDESGENGTAYEEAIKLNEVEISEATRKFVADVESVEFTNPELVWVGKVDEATTFGGLKEANGLEVEYSTDLTEEQIAEINAQTVEVGDWALISMQPFMSEETLTVTMRNGDQWIVRVTDNQQTSLNDIDKDETYVLYAVQNGTTYVLKTDGTTEPLGDRSLDMLDNNYKWKIVWRYTDYGDNYKRYYSVIPETDPYKSMSLSELKDNLVKDKNTNQIYIEESGDGTFYFGGYNHVLLAFEDESFQGRHGPWVWRWRFTGWDTSTWPWTPNYVHEINDWHYTNNDDTEHSPVPMVIYKQEDVDTYEFYVKTDNLKQGYIIGTDKDGQSFSENNIVEHVTVTNNSKKNKYEIKAVPQSDKYLFDYWDLDGVKQTYGATIPANTIPIKANGNILTAHFKNNPNWNPENKPGREVDEAELLEWINGLKNQDHLMDPDGFSKTAEVFDYENRVYRIDLTAKSDFTTISGVADLGFVLDVSSSMRFPASLMEYRKNGNNVRIKVNDLWNTNSNAYKSLNTNQTYYLIADEESTATVFRLNYSYGKWYRQDASKTGYGDEITSTTDFQGEVGKTYQIYTAAGAAVQHDDYTDTTNRLDYLNWSISNNDANNRGLVQELQDILNNYLSRGDSDNDKANEPEVKIAYNTFNKTLQANDYEFKSVKKNTPTITTNPGGGTSTDVGLLAAAGYKRNESGYNTKNMTSYNRDEISGYPDLTDTENAVFKENSVFKKDSNVGFDWDPNSSKYAVLITDGAPQRNGNDIDVQMVKDAANYLKAGEDGKLGTDDDVTLITVGLSMGNVKKGANLLWELADRDEDNDPYFYDAQDPSELKNVLYEILQTVTGKAIIVGNVTDTINDAFYPVDVTTGKPLENGYVIDLNGNWIANRESALTDEQRAAGYGVISKGSDGLYTVRWTSQNFVPTGIGWHGFVYVKAKEDFFGGNTVRTNYNDAEFKATGYKGKPGDVTVNLASEYQEVKKQESPRVNVDELHFTDNSTEWTVYLGTEVNPKDELQRLFNKIEIEEEVFRSTEDKTKVNGNKEQYRYDFVEDTSDQRTVKTGEPVKFTMAELLEKLPESERNKINWDTLISLANQPVKPRVNQGEPEPEEPEGGWNTGITLNYEHYNQDYPGTITITLVEEHDPNKHVTDQVGDAVETYTLSILFSPDYTHLSKDQGGQGDVEYHTGKYGTGSEGVGTGTQGSTNTHTINVFSKPLDILKVDKDNAAITEKSATFELLRLWTAGDTDESKKVIFGTTPGYSGYKLDGADLTGTYYLVDTQDTDTNTGIARFGTGTDTAKLLSSAKDPYIIIEKAAPSGYAKDVNAKTITIVTDGTNMNLYSDLNKAAINNANYPSTRNPYNWNQAVQFQVKEYNATSNQNQTSVIDYVNKNSGAKITLNQPVYTAGKPWKATGSARNPIYVFSNIENTKELIRDDEDGVGIFRIQFLNEPGAIDITIHKVDDKNNALAGATFKLMNGSQIVSVASAGDGVVIEPKVTGETVTIKNNTFTIPAGGVIIKNLQTSDTEYAIVEVVSPDGYVITNDTPVKFKVTSGELTDKTMTTGVEYASEGNDFTIPNTPGAALPNTGGPGTKALYLIGTMLTGLAGAGVLMRRKRRRVT